MKRLTEELSREHQNILKVIAALEKECTSLEKDGNILYPMAEQALDSDKRAAMLEQFEEVGARFADANSRYLAFVQQCEAR